MSEQKRSIYRSKALEAYRQGQRQTIMPRFVSPRIFSTLWLFFGFMTIGAGLIAMAPIPVFVTGTAVVMAQQRISENEYVLVLFLPSAYHTKLEPSQPVIIESDSIGQYETIIIDRLPEVLSPTIIRERFDLPLPMTQAMAVAFASWQPPPSDLPHRAYEGSIFTATVLVCSQPLWSLLFPKDDS